MIASQGRIVAYALTAENVQSVNKRRSDATTSKIGKLESGTVVHVGNPHSVGDIVPGMIVKVWADDLVNLQVHLDGNDLLWVTSSSQGYDEGQWHEFPRV